MHSRRPFWRETFSHSQRQEVRTLPEFYLPTAAALFHYFFSTNKYCENIFSVKSSQASKELREKRARSKKKEQKKIPGNRNGAYLHCL